MGTDSVVETLEAYFRQTPTPLICAYLYGSHARREGHAGRDGKLLVERDLAERVRFEVRARNEYFDLLPHLRRYRGFRAA